VSSIDPRGNLAILVVSAVLIWIDSTVLGIALERLADPVDGLGATPGQLQWAIGVYSLLLATALFLAGALGDRYGHRTVPMLGLLGVSYGLIEGGHQGGWNRWQVWAGIGAGPLLLAGFLYSECREREPTFDPRLFRNRRFAAGNFALAAVFLTLTGQSFYWPFTCRALAA